MTSEEEWAGLVEEYLDPPTCAYSVGLCKECDQEVWISHDHRPAGRAQSCEEHWPLSKFSEPRPRRFL